MKRLAILIFLHISIIISADVVDFGIHGKQYKISERNANELVKEKLKELDYKKIEEKIDKEIESLKVSRVKIKTSMQDITVTSKDLYKAKWDIRDIDGSLLYAKGDYIPTTLPKGVQMELCFVDGSLLKGVVDEVVASFGKKCKYFVNKKNIDVFAKEYGVEAYPMGGQNAPYLARYKVDVLPTKITRFDDMVTMQKLNIKRITLFQYTREQR